ncbi:cobalamin biosynthesis protein [Tabrizicola sp. BL-A-41-H6]|uniref:cobalamin biosynthesis protein n=1 Tax=Tabrizicola sp. BL-A-41-H6 TaxID=3421107 RepID=UPI003D66F017
MRVAGFGFRKGATEAALRDALMRVGGPDGVTMVATVADKAGGLRNFARSLGLPLVAVPPGDLPGQAVATRSARVTALYGTGSLAEAAALAAAGPGARLIAPRAQSADGTATAAIAEGAKP